MMRDVREMYRLAGYLLQAELRCKSRGRIDMAIMWKTHRIKILDKISKIEMVDLYGWRAGVLAGGSKCTRAT